MHRHRLVPATPSRPGPETGPARAAAPGRWWRRLALLLALATWWVTTGTSAQPMALPRAAPGLRLAGLTEHPVTAAVAAAAPSAALGAADLAVLVAEGDPTSEAIGRAYQQARGIPEQNIVRVPVPTNREALNASDFSTLKAMIDARLPAGIQATLVTWSQPSRVQGPQCAMGLTSALAFGWDPRWCGACSRTLPSPYFNSASSRPWTDLRMRPAMMLGAATVTEAQALIQRGLAAEGLMSKRNPPTASGWLMRTSDGARGVRWPDFVLAGLQAVPGVAWHYVDNSDGTATDVVSARSDLMFYFTGLVRVPLTGVRFLPGAVADHLTSFGALWPPAHGQMLATEWLAAGATGSYGTVEEPCNHQEKFPRASVLVAAYGRGATLIEAYWKSVQWPGQGVFFGDPLARPWAPRP